MRVSVVIPSFYPAVVYGGPIFSSLYACQELAANGVEVYVSATNANGDKRLNVPVNTFCKQSENLWVKYYNETITGRFSLALAFNLWKDIKVADVIHVQAIFSSPTPLGLFYASLFKKQVILSPRGALGEWCLQNKRAIFKTLWLKLLVMPYKKRIVWHATSELEKEEILQLDKRAKVSIIPNGFEPGILPVGAGGSSLDGKKRIISMGRIHKKKGFDILIQSFKRVLLIYPEAELYIAGKDDGEKKSLEDLAKNLQIMQAVHFVDHLSGNEKNKFLSGADVFVLPSHNENFGNVYAEALAAGTPIVASTFTPWEEVEAAGCGRWVPNTIEDTTNAILDILARDSVRIRQNALNYVQKYKWENIALQFKDLYESLS